MFETPDVLRMAQDLARYAGTRQTLVAKNIANADTPGYRAQDLPSFAEAYQSSGTAEMRQSRPGHMTAETSTAKWRPIDAGGTPSPNGNSVSLEEEMVRGTRAQSDYNLALTVYRSSLDVMRSALGRGR